MPIAFHPDAGPPPADMPTLITPDLLRRWPLPLPDDDADKQSRGRVLVVGGSPEMPGAVILAATAALRAGAGKLQIATCRDIAHLVAVEIPEARVFALPQTQVGGIQPSAANQIADHAARGATPLQATVWGVHLHASAGDALAERIGLLGFLARELLAEIPGLLARLSAKPDNGA